ncbi:hypothetical protein KHA96_15035 [Bacillus sp. FJAT-49711]|nr:hypothetical protein [Bacillus sp. FJAT-49711]MBS4219629.1 hypothetical protein [Bacillus sp. FJAT-49711]
MNSPEEDEGVIRLFIKERPKFKIKVLWFMKDSISENVLVIAIILNFYEY